MRTHQNIATGMHARPAVEDLKPLTSLRFVAALAIVFLHARLYTDWRWLAPIHLPLDQGVSFFFVLSGFILTHVYSARRGIGYWQFVRLRAARLWPVHLVTFLLVILFVDPTSFHGEGLFDDRLTILANLSLTQALFPFPAYIFAWNSVSWSISTELGFYLCFPFLLAQLPRYWLRNLLIASLLIPGAVGGLWLVGVPLVSADVYAATIDTASYADPLTRGFEFCLGMASWVIWDRHLRHANTNTWAWTLIEMIALWGAWLWLSNWYWDFAAWFPVSWLMPWIGSSSSCWLFAILIVTFAGGHGIIGRLLSGKVPVWLGEISFCIYMVHQILFKIVNWDLGLRSELAFFPALILISAALHHLVEQPCRRLLSGQMPALRFRASG